MTLFAITPTMCIVVSLSSHYVISSSISELIFNESVGLLNDAQYHKDFLLNFAKEKGFDPSVQSNWLGISRKHILRVKVLGIF